MKVLSQESDPVFNEKLRLLLESMKKWGSELTGVDLEIEIENFMETLWHYYVEYFQHHIEEAKVTALPYQELLISSVHLINHPYIAREWLQVVNADDYDYPWAKACKLRSNVETFHAMFGSFTGKLKDSKIVEFIEERKCNLEEGLKVNPEKIPKSHWWWFIDFDC